MACQLASSGSENNRCIGGFDNGVDRTVLFAQRSDPREIYLKCHGSESRAFQGRPNLHS